MKITKTENLSDQQKQSIVQLWNAEYPAKLQHSGTDSLDEYLSKLGNPQHYLLTDADENIKGWLACFDRDGEKWFAMIVDTSEQRKGYGSQLLTEVKKYENEVNGWAMDKNEAVKSNGETYSSPIGFYLKNGFQVLNEIRLETETMSAVKIKWSKN